MLWHGAGIVKSCHGWRVNSTLYVNVTPQPVRSWSAQTTIACVWPSRLTSWDNSCRRPAMKRTPLSGPQWNRFTSVLFHFLIAWFCHTEDWLCFCNFCSVFWYHFSLLYFIMLEVRCKSTLEIFEIAKFIIVCVWGSEVLVEKHVFLKRSSSFANLGTCGLLNLPFWQQ